MKIINARRLAAVGATALALGALVSTGPAQGATGDLAYHCTITKDFSYDFTFNQATNAPARAYLAKKYVYTATTTFPGAGVAFARGLGVTYIDGAIDATVYRNGTPITIHAPIPRTSVPTSTNVMALVANGVLPAYTKTGGAAVVYKPGAIKFSVNAHKADGSSLFDLDKGSCTMPANTTRITTTTYVRSPSRTVEAVTYSKATKKIAAAAKVSVVSGIAPGGKVAFTLYKGRARVRTVVGRVNAARKASVSFAGVSKKGSYRVVATYSGSAFANGSSASKALTLK
jgi:hypothetical protein